jgi:hypothetical protein
VLLVAVLLGLAVSPAAGQDSWAPSRAADPADVGTLDGIVRAFYEVVSGPAGAPRDWARDSTLYLPGVRFVIVDRSPDGGWTARSVDHGTFAATAGPALAGGFYEREIRRVTRRFGPMVDVWSTYEWRIREDGPLGGRGINAIQLLDDGDRWWIAGAMWVDEDPANPIPDAFLPPEP